jgi:N-acyl-D-amino-acid deacylase
MTALIYPPAFFAKTEEIIEMCKVAAKYKGKYTTHMHSEGNQLIEAVQETIRISREAGLPAEIHHLKASAAANWNKMDQVIRMVENPRRSGLKITADMYTYPAGGTGLDASMPPWVSVGVQHVFVNGTAVLKDGESTGAKPGQALWGPGKVK